MIQIDARNITWDLGKDITYEVLIENLGGYETAKSKLRENGSLHAERLKKALLEYRRQHNIFEVGDKVVHIYDSGNSMLFTVKDITDHGYSFGNDWGWRGVISNMGVGHAFRHATTKEIKAGKRLEVNQ